MSDCRRARSLCMENIFSKCIWGVGVRKCSLLQRVEVTICWCHVNGLVNSPGCSKLSLNQRVSVQFKSVRELNDLKENFVKIYDLLR